MFYIKQVTRQYVTGFEEQYIALKKVILMSVYYWRRRPNLLGVDWGATSSSSGSSVLVMEDDWGLKRRLGLNLWVVSCGASVVGDDEGVRLKERRGVKPDEEDEELDEGELLGELVGRDSDEERKRPREAVLVGAASVVVVASVWVCWRRDGRRKRLEPPRWLVLGCSVVVVEASVVAADDFLLASDGRLLRSMAPGLTTDTSFLRPPFGVASVVVVFSVVGSVTGSGSTNSSWTTGAASASTGASASAGAAGSSTPKS